jgi:hypothetical protein
VHRGNLFRDSGSLLSSAVIFCIFFLTSLSLCSPCARLLVRPGAHHSTATHHDPPQTLSACPKPPGRWGLSLEDVWHSWNLWYSRFHQPICACQTCRAEAGARGGALAVPLRPPPLPSPLQGLLYSHSARVHMKFFSLFSGGVFFFSRTCLLERLSKEHGQDARRRAPQGADQRRL